MAKYCRFCGNPVREGANFCKTCGHSLAKSTGQLKIIYGSSKVPAGQTRDTRPEPESFTAVSAHLKTPETLNSSTENIVRKMPLNMSVSPASTLSAAGEAVLGDFGDIFSQTAAQVSNVLSPAKALLETMKSFLGGSIGMILKPKVLIPSLLMAALWFILSLMKDSGIPFLDTLSRITYTEVGFGADTLSAVGGIFGKGAVAAALASLFTGGLPSAFKGIGSLFRTKGEKRSLLLTLLGLICGASLYYFFSGAKIPSEETAAAGIAGALISLEILGTKNSVFYKLIQSLTSKAKDGVRTAMNGRCDSLLTGLTLGFTLGIIFLGRTVSAAGADLYYEYEKYGTKYFVLNINGLNSTSIAGSNTSGSTSNPFDGEDADFRLATGSGVMARGNKMRIEFEWMSPNPLDEWSIGVQYNLKASKTYCGNKNLYDSFNIKSERISTQWSSVVTRNSSGLILEITAPTEGEIESITLDVGMDYNCGEDRNLGVICSMGNVPFEIALTGASTPAVCPDIVVTEQAKIEPGRDEGVSIPIEIIEGIKDKLESIDQETLRKTALISSGGAVIAGGISALIHSGKKDRGSENDESEEKKKKKSYKMYVWKDFGDAIRKGAKPVKVYARISQFIEGVEYDAPELTDKITVSGRGLNVRAAGFENSYLCAEVSADAGTTAETGTLIFTLSGPGGTFSREINFRLVGDPRIVFPDETEDGSGWNLNNEINTVNMAAGLGGRDKLRFVLIDAAEEPKNIRFLNHEGFDITYEKDLENAYTYWAVIENHTSPMKKDNGVFADMQDRTFTVEADFSGDLTIRGYFGVYLYPQGFSVLRSGGPNDLVKSQPGIPAKLQNGYLNIVSYATRGKDELTLDPLIRPTAFDMCFAVLNPDKTAKIIMDQSSFMIDKLQPVDQVSENVLMKYKCQIETYDGNNSRTCFIRPQAMNPELTGEYEVLLPVWVTVFGITEKADVPLRLVGLEPGPPAEWYQEYKLLQEAIIRYYPEEKIENKLALVRENYNTPEKCDVMGLRSLRRTVILWSMTYWQQQKDIAEGADAIYWARVWLLSEWGARKLKWAGNIAFTILICYGLGPNYEAWISPMKDFAVETIGEMIASCWGDKSENSAEKYAKNFEDKLYTAFENLLLNQIDTGDLSKSLSKDTRTLFLKTGFILTGFLLLDFFKNYRAMSENQRDYWKAFSKAFSNLSVNAVKLIFASYVGRWMKSETMRKFFKSKFMRAVNDKVKGATRSHYTYNGKPLMVRYKGQIVPVQGQAVGNVDIDRTGVHGLRLKLPDGNIAVIKNVKMHQENVFLGYVEVISGILSDLFGNAVEICFSSMMDKAEKSDDIDPYLINFALDIGVLDPDIAAGVEPLIVRIDMKKILEDPASFAFNLVFESIFGCLKLTDLILSLFPDPVEMLQKYWQAGINVWKYLADGTGGKQIDWSIFEE